MYEFLHSLDIGIFQLINQLSHFALADIFATFLWQNLTYILVILSAILWKLFPKHDKYIPLLAIIIFIFTAVLNQYLLKNIFHRYRPYIKIPATITVYGKLNDYSFPSGHAASVVAFTIPFLLFSKNKKLKISLLFFSLLIGLDRVYMGHHYPWDVLAGYITGGVISLIGCLFWQTVVRKKYGILLRMQN